MNVCARFSFTIWIIRRWVGSCYYHVTYKSRCYSSWYFIKRKHYLWLITCKGKARERTCVRARVMYTRFLRKRQRGLCYLCWTALEKLLNLCPGLHRACVSECSTVLTQGTSSICVCSTVSFISYIYGVQSKSLFFCQMFAQSGKIALEKKRGKKVKQRLQ